MSNKTQLQKVDVDLVNKFSDFRLVFLILSAFCIQIVALNSLKKLDTSWVEPPAEKVEKLSPELFKTFSFGHLQTGIDIIWLRILQDDAISRVHEGMHPPVFYDLDLATDLDPAFLEAYVGGANLLAVIRNDGPGARDLLLKGEKFRTNYLQSYPDFFQSFEWANSWRVPILLAYVYLFSLNDINSAKIYFTYASHIPNSPHYLTDLVHRLGAPGGEYEVGTKLLDFMARQNKDERTLDAIARKKQSLFIGALLLQINQSFIQDAIKHKVPSSSFNNSAIMERLWSEFCAKNHKPQHDPMGGALTWDPELKKIVTSTPHQKVFGLD